MAQQYPYGSTTQSNDSNKDKDKTKEQQKEKDASKASLGDVIGESRGAVKDEKASSDQSKYAWPKQEAQAVAKDPTTSPATASTSDKTAADTKSKGSDTKDVVVSKAVEVKDLVVEKAVEAKDKAIEVEQAVAEKAVELKDEAVEKLAEAKDVVVETLDDVGAQAKRWGREAWQFTSANAVPLAILGLGTGLLFANAKRPSDARRPSQPRPSVRAPRSNTRAATGFDPISRESSLYPAISPLEETGLALSASDSDRTTMQKIEDGAVRGSAFIRRNVEQGTDYVRRNVVRATDATRTFAGKNPLAFPMATLAMGVGIGMLLPSIRREPKVLRPKLDQSDQSIDDARVVAQSRRLAGTGSIDRLS